MSYARMEGFLDIELDTKRSGDLEISQDSWGDTLETRVTERWILTIFITLLTGLVVLEIALG